MAKLVKALATNPDCQSSISQTNMMQRTSANCSQTKHKHFFGGLSGKEV